MAKLPLAVVVASSSAALLTYTNYVILFRKGANPDGCQIGIYAVVTILILFLENKEQNTYIIGHTQLGKTKFWKLHHLS